MWNISVFNKWKNLHVLMLHISDCKYGFYFDSEIQTDQWYLEIIYDLCIGISRLGLVLKTTALF